MGIFDWWPYTNLHSLNTDWLVHIVHKFINESKVIFEDQEEQIKWLKDNFEDLKNYVNTYFDNLDVHQEISDKLDEMLENGELEAIISQNILDYAPLVTTFDGEAIVRIRTNYRKVHGDDTSPSRGYQQGCVYSPSGDYSYNSQKYIYIWQTWSDNNDTKLVTLDTLTNTVINEQIIQEARHGGSMIVEDNILYTISNNKLLKFSVSNPRVPTLLSIEDVLSTYAHLLGKLDGHFLVMSSARAVYKTTDFSSFEYAYTLTESSNDVLQDICLDTVRRIIYRVSYGPNTIHMYSADTGKKLGTMKVPSIISSIGIAESEFISVHGQYIYYGGISAVGCPGSTQMDLAIIYCDLLDKNTSRVQTYNEGALRTMYIDYENADGLNRDVNASTAGYRTFKYVEDAQNATRDLNQVSFRFESDYPCSMYLYRKGIFNLNGKKVGAIRIENDIVLMGITTSFLGNPINLSIKTWIYCAEGSRLKIRGLNLEPTLGQAQVFLWAYRSEILVNNRYYLANCFFEESIITGQGIIANNVYSKNSSITCNCIRLVDGDSIHIDDQSTIIGPCVASTAAERFNLNTINDFTFPVQGTMFFQNGPNIIPPLTVYKASDGETGITLAYVNTSGNREVVNGTISRISTEHFSGDRAFTSRKYKVVLTDTPPSILGRFMCEE